MKCDGMFKLLRVEAATRTWCNLGRTSQSRWLSESPNKNLKDIKKISSNCFCRCCFGWDYSQHHHFTPWDLGCNPDKPILFNYLWSIFREGAKNVFINIRYDLEANFLNYNFELALLHTQLLSRYQISNIDVQQNSC